MKLKSLIVLLLAGIWGVGSWWWYTCKVKEFCGADTTTTQTAAAITSGAAGSQMGGGKSSDLDKTTQAKADADKAAAEQAKADADKVAAEQAKADADKAAAEQAKADADKATAEQAKADADKAAAEQAKADADKAAAEQAKADADKAAAEQAKADADKAAAEKAGKDSDKITIEAAAPTNGSDIGPATLHFPTGSANPQLADETRAYFEKVAKFLKDNSSATVTIVGHTDNKGKPDKNKELGKKRAEMLQKMLVDLGAPKDRIKASSEGADKPVADNNTEEGRKKNRRVEINPVKN